MLRFVRDLVLMVAENYSSFYFEFFSEWQSKGNLSIKHASVITLLLDGQIYIIEGVDSISPLEGVGIGEGRPIAERK